MDGQIEQHHMNIPWHDFEDKDQNILHADLQTKTTIIGRVGIMMLACGTGACAAVVASVLNDLTDEEVIVKLLGGELSVRWDRKVNHVFLEGSAVKVFDGVL